MECVRWWQPGNGPPARVKSPVYNTQETEDGSEGPDIKRPPVKELPDVANDTGLPPFTGEDVEQPRRPKRDPRPKDQLTN